MEPVLQNFLFAQKKMEEEVETPEALTALRKYIDNLPKVRCSSVTNFAPSVACVLCGRRQPWVWEQHHHLRVVGHVLMGDVCRSEMVDTQLCCAYIQSRYIH